MRQKRSLGGNSLLLLLCLCLFSLVFPNCSEPVTCVDSQISPLTLDPNNSACRADCECSNFEFDGVCISGKCKSFNREPCNAKGKKRECLLPEKYSKGCKKGIQACQPNYLEGYKSWGNCERLAPAEREDTQTLCQDGIDNDCDGKIDLADPECKNFCNPGKKESCYSLEAEEKKTGKSTQGVGECRAGTKTCAASGVWGPCLREKLPSPEECNLKDDDCNGQIDDFEGQGINTLVRECFTAKSGCALQEDGTYKCHGCVRQKDGKYKCTSPSPCRVGIQYCFNGNWDPCEDQHTPKTESCNGLDDDCNGKIDDNPKDAPLCQNQKGPCKNARVSTNSCKNGRWLGCTDADYKRTFPGYTQKEVGSLCNDVDDNCDGLINENLVLCVGTVAGRAVNGFRNGLGTEAEFYLPHGVFVRKDGHILILDTANHLIRKIDRCGYVSTFAGTGLGGSRDGTRLQAEFQYLTDIVADKAGNLYVLDHNEHKIRKISKGGVVSTFAGSGIRGFKNGPGATAQFNFPFGMAIDTQDNIYVADTENHLIRKIAPDGIVSTLVGLGKHGFRDGDVKTALLDSPAGLVFSPKHNALFVAEPPNHSIRKVTLDGTVSLFAGGGGPTEKPSLKDGKGAQARFVVPLDLTVDNNGTFYTISAASLVRRISFDGTVTTIAGVPQTKDTAKHAKDGPISSKTPLKLPSARFLELTGIALDRDGNILVTERRGKIRKIHIKLTKDSPSHCVHTFAGSSKSGSRDSSILESSTFFEPLGLAYGNNGEIYVSDTNHRIREILPEEGVKTFAGSRLGYKDGPKRRAKFTYPTGMLVLPDGAMIVADLQNHRIRKIDLKGEVSTIAGSFRGFRNGKLGQALFHQPVDMVRDPKGNIYLTDKDNHLIRKIDTLGNVTTFAGQEPSTPGRFGTAVPKPGYKDGKAKEAQFSFPIGLAFAPDGSLLVADSGNHCIRRIDTKGMVTTIAGYPKVPDGEGGFQNGKGKEALFRSPFDLQVDPRGNIYVSDTGNSCIRLIKPDGKGAYQVSTYAGKCEKQGFVDDASDNALFYGPTSILLDPRGNLYVADSKNHRIRILPKR